MKNWWTSFQNSPSVWTLSAFLVASPRLFEIGISLDPALYAVVARNLSLNNEWWNLKFGETLFPIFFEQPFLILWLQSLVFKIFGSSDFSTRILGLCFGAGTFLYLFRMAELISNRRLANVFAFLCLLDVNFIGRFATLYLEVPLTFFTFGSLYYYLRWNLKGIAINSVWSGIFLSGAILTKGFAALPLLGTIGVLSLAHWKTKLHKDVGFLTTCMAAFLIVAAFCLLQAHYGLYNFAQLYFDNAFVERTLKVGILVGVTGFLKKFLLLCGPALVLSMFSIRIVRCHREYRPVFMVGFTGALMHIGANATLGFPNLHYYHGIFPFVNLTAAIAVTWWLRNRGEIAWGRIGLLIGVSLHIFWNLVPIPMRRKPPEDFIQLKSIMSELGKTVPKPLETIGIAENDWIYRQFSYWYWGLDSRNLGDSDAVSAPIVLSRRGYDLGSKLSGYSHCSGSKQYNIWVKELKLLELCRNQPFDMRMIR